MQTSRTFNKVAAAVILSLGSGALVTGLLPPVLALDATAPVRIEMSVPDFSALVQQNAVAVVNVSVIGKSTPILAGRGLPFAVPDDDPENPFGEFFKRFPQPSVPQAGTERPVQGLGSGFIISVCLLYTSIPQLSPPVLHKPNSSLFLKYLHILQYLGIVGNRLGCEALRAKQVADSDLPPA